MYEDLLYVGLSELYTAILDESHPSYFRDYPDLNLGLCFFNLMLQHKPNRDKQDLDNVGFLQYL